MKTNKKVVRNEGKCPECENGATSPVGDEKYCYSHWSERVKHLEEQAEWLYSIKQFKITNRKDQIIVEHPWATSPDKICSRIFIFPVPGADLTYVTIVMFDDLFWDQPIPHTLQDGQTTITNRDAFHNVVIDLHSDAIPGYAHVNVIKSHSEFESAGWF